MPLGARVVTARAPSRPEVSSGFGEIALLRDIPRTATITALTDLDLNGLEREEFLNAVTTHGEASDQEEQVVSRFLTLA